MNALCRATTLLYWAGWKNRPSVGLKNAALVEVTTAQGDQPVEGAEGTLTAQIVYGGKSKELLLRPLAGSPGTYVGDFIPTRRGTYTLKPAAQSTDRRLMSAMRSRKSAVSIALTFPEPQADLQKSIDALQSELSTTRMLAVVGAALGAIGLVLAGVAIGRSRR